MKSYFITTLIVMMALGLVLGCGALQTYQPAGPVNCAVPIEWDVAKEADITIMNCYIQNYKGWGNMPVWHFEVGIKNIADRPERYRVRITLPKEGVSAGGLLPRKGKPPILAPGKEAKVIYPLHYDKMPDTAVVIVETIPMD
jgi:hypothetical protein